MNWPEPKSFLSLVLLPKASRRKLPPCSPTPDTPTGTVISALNARMLRLALGFTLVYIVLLVVTGFRAHSLALLSEAGHNVSDFFALLLSWVAAYLSERPATSTKTYGWRRAGVLAAFVNATTLIVIAVLIFYSAIQRLSHPVAVQAGLVMWVAGVRSAAQRQLSPCSCFAAGAT